jgi:hypothetical protein
MMLLTFAFAFFLLVVLASLVLTFMPVPVQLPGDAGGRADERTVHLEAFVSASEEIIDAEPPATIILPKPVEPQHLKEAA